MELWADRNSTNWNEFGEIWDFLCKIRSLYTVKSLFDGIQFQKIKRITILEPIRIELLYATLFYYK